MSSLSRVLLVVVVVVVVAAVAVIRSNNIKHPEGCVVGLVILADSKSSQTIS